jgi:hypothetical protein
MKIFLIFKDLDFKQIWLQTFLKKVKAFADKISKRGKLGLEFTFL